MTTSYEITSIQRENHILHIFGEKKEIRITRALLSFYPEATQRKRTKNEATLQQLLHSKRRSRRARSSDTRFLTSNAPANWNKGRPTRF